jgi:hypothetical protein
VSVLAQAMLLRAGVSLVTGVPAANLHRLSRATGARILPSINYVDKLAAAETVGCGAARFAALPGGRWLAVEAAEEAPGVTVLLRGAAEDVRPAKALLRHLVGVARGLRLWAAFAFDAGLAAHRPILEAIEARDPALVERLTFEHMSAAATRLVTALQLEASERARTLRRRRDGTSRPCWLEKVPPARAVGESCHI